MNIHILKKPLKSQPILIFLFVLGLVLVIDFSVADTPNSFFVRNVEAVIGRPASAGSVGGVRRRTRRRTAHRVKRGTPGYMYSPLAVPRCFQTV